jgi:LacI family transcriptional regulator, gluconate utilization system Gnt-I transcriptional repressor
MRRNGRPRIVDVARQAGVSAITVSRALREPARVAGPTRAAVLRAVETLGYVPDLVAGALASRRSRVVGAAVPTVAGAMFADTVQGMSDALREHGYQLLLGAHGYDLAAERDLVQAFLGRRADGVILTGVQHHPATRRILTEAGAPVVEMWDIGRAPLDMTVGFSNFNAARAMARHLLGRGYRRLAFVSGPLRGHDRSRPRRDGFRAGAKAAGASLVELHVADGSGMRSGAQAIAELLRRAPELDAAFFVNDVMAVGALMECRRRGWATPGRIAIAGFGDFEVAAAVAPSLTTVRISGYEIGRRAALMLAARLAGEPVAPATVDLGFEIVPRESA